MTIRNIPFGYEIRNGEVVIDERDSNAVIEMFESYNSGKSLLKISVEFNQRQIEYAPGVVGWNKARLKRLLEDRRYTGIDGFPVIIDSDTFHKAQTIKRARNTQSETDRKSGVYQLNAPVRCPFCGTNLRRRNDNRCQTKNRWCCQLKGCKVLIVKSDDDLLADLTELLNQVIAKPEMLAIHPEDSICSPERRKVENEIGRLMDASDFDKEQVRQKLFERFTLAYRDIDSVPYIDLKMKADFEKSGPLSVFSPDLFNRTVQEILFGPDGTVSIMLINQQIIRKEATTA